MQNILLVFLGGGIGSVCRYLISLFCEKNISMRFPCGTLTVNVLGSLIAGFLLILLLNKTSISPQLKPLLIIGFCGGFTTLSSFSLDVMTMFKNGNYWLSFWYIVLTFALSLLAVYLGGSCAERV